MQKPMAQLAVGGEQEQPRGVGVEPSHRKERRVRGQWVGHERGHREGRKRQVRRMLEAVGHPVIALHREAFGPLELARMSG